MDLTTSGLLTWYTKNDRYSRARLNADLETIRSHYLNRGYLEFNVESTQVTISPDKQSIAITITVSEGQPYTVTAVRLQGDYLGREEEFRRLVRIKPGEPYRAVDAAANRPLQRPGDHGVARRAAAAGVCAARGGGRQHAHTR
jgi:outer membrane protein insertion porin family